VVRVFEVVLLGVSEARRSLDLPIEKSKPDSKPLSDLQKASDYGRNRLLACMQGAFSEYATNKNSQK